MARLRRLVLVRHGETDGHSSVRFHGSTDVDLSAEGRAQMRRVARHRLRGRRISSSRARCGARWRAAAIAGGGAAGAARARLPRDPLRALGGAQPRGDPGARSGALRATGRSARPASSSRAASRARPSASACSAGSTALLAEDARDALLVLHKGVIRVIVETLTGEAPGATQPAHRRGCIVVTRHPDGTLVPRPALEQPSRRRDAGRGGAHGVALARGRGAAGAPRSTQAASSPAAARSASPLATDVSSPPLRSFSSPKRSREERAAPRARATSRRSGTRGRRPRRGRACGGAGGRRRPPIGGELLARSSPRTPRASTGRSIARSSCSKRKRAASRSESSRFGRSTARKSRKPRSRSTRWRSAASFSGSSASRRRSSRSCERLRRAQEREVVPALEVARRSSAGIGQHPAEDRAELARRGRAAARPGGGRASRRRRRRRGATPSFPRSARARSPLGAHAGPDAQQREVARAAAEVADQDQLVAVEPALVVPGGADRLVLELDVGEAGVAERGARGA